MDFAFLQGVTDTANASTYTFSSQNLGAADGGRYVIVCFQARSNVGSLSISSVTVGGVSATAVATSINDSSTFNIAAIYIAAVPTGTTGDVVVTLNNSCLRAAIQLYRAVGISTAAAHDAANDNTNNKTVSIDVPAGGFAVASSGNTSTGACSWTGLTEDYDEAVEAIRVTSASDEFVAEQTGLAIVVDFGVGTVTTLAAASWEPDSGGGAGAARRRRLICAGAH